MGYHFQKSLPLKRKKGSKELVKRSIKSVLTDFLVIGSGVAGLSAAISLSRVGSVIVLNKGKAMEGSSESAQGGIAVAISEEDSIGFHLDDTLAAGRGLCREEAVKVMVEEGPERIRDLISWGAEFDKEGGRFAFAREAAHSRERILRARGDATGEEIVKTLLREASSFPQISILEHHFTIDLLIGEKGCMGALVMRETDVEIFLIETKATIIATGGVGRVYSRTTNPPVVTGDGIAMAFRAGAILEDMEFIQFHPTSLFLPGAPPFLLSEAMRGEGAIIRNIKKDAFLSRYHPDAEMAPRDMVARATWLEMQAIGSRHAYLDLTHLDPAFIRRRFPKIYATCLQYDLDITEEMIPVSPGAHFIMGGIKTDINGSTNIRGLYAAGEAACTGVHGANRLASNSLLEGLVFGSRAGEKAAKSSAKKEVVRGGRNNLARDLISDPGKGREDSRDDNDKIINSIRRLMWDKAGIVRSKDGLNEALIFLKELNSLVRKDGQQITRGNLELKNMITIAQLITLSALTREGSIGAHYRSDFPDKGKNWGQHLDLKGGKVTSRGGSPDTPCNPQVYWCR